MQQLKDNMQAYSSKLQNRTRRKNNENMEEKKLIRVKQRE